MPTTEQDPTAIAELFVEQFYAVYTPEIFTAKPDVAEERECFVVSGKHLKESLARLLALDRLDTRIDENSNVIRHCDRNKAQTFDVDKLKMRNIELESQRTKLTEVKKGQL